MRCNQSVYWREEKEVLRKVACDEDGVLKCAGTHSSLYLHLHAVARRLYMGDMTYHPSGGQVSWPKPQGCGACCRSSKRGITSLYGESSLGRYQAVRSCDVGGA